MLYEQCSDDYDMFLPFQKDEARTALLFEETVIKLFICILKQSLAFLTKEKKGERA